MIEQLDGRETGRFCRNLSEAWRRGDSDMVIDAMEGLSSDELRYLLLFYIAAH